MSSEASCDSYIVCLQLPGYVDALFTELWKVVEENVWAPWTTISPTIYTLEEKVEVISYTDHTLNQQMILCILLDKEFLTYWISVVDLTGYSMGEMVPIL